MAPCLKTSTAEIRRTRLISSIPHSEIVGIAAGVYIAEYDHGALALVYVSTAIEPTSR
jgi:hypothetical protein